MNNKYGSVLVDPSVSETVVSLLVPARSGYSLTGIWICANCDVNWTVYLNGATLIVGITSAAQKGGFVPFPTTWGLQDFDLVAVMAQHSEDTPQFIYSTLFYEQL